MATNSFLTHIFSPKIVTGSGELGSVPYVVKTDMKNVDTLYPNAIVTNTLQVMSDNILGSNGQSLIGGSGTNETLTNLTVTNQLVVDVSANIATLNTPNLVITSGTANVKNPVDNTGLGSTEYCISTNSLRWAIGHANPETGSNAGSDYCLFSYDDNGAFLGTAYRVIRANNTFEVSSNVNMLQNLNVEGYITGNITQQIPINTTTVTLTSAPVRADILFSSYPDSRYIVEVSNTSSHNLAPTKSLSCIVNWDGVNLVGGSSLFLDVQNYLTITASSTNNSTLNQLTFIAASSTPPDSFVIRIYQTSL